jgi:hypothetical protein
MAASMPDAENTNHASPPEQQSVRLLMHVRYDISEASQNIAELTNKLADDGGNAMRVFHQIIAEIEWMLDLLDELAAKAPR